MMNSSRTPDVSTAASPPRQPIEQQQLNSDRELIGSGGQGTVYLIELPEDTPPKRVAVKEPVADSRTISTDRIQTFLEEAETWQTVDRREREKQRWNDYEYIVGVIDTGDTIPWIAMEYMDGGGLDDRLAANSAGIPLNEALWIGECICRGMEIAHSNGIAHLDLKPANVLFRETSSGLWDVPKISDWGLARVLAEQTGTMEGLSVDYAAPEQFEPKEFGDPDMLTDIYQVGVLVYAMLTGEPPYTGTQLSVMRNILSDNDPDPVQNHRSNLPKVADKAILRALSREKTDRHSHIIDLRKALQTAQDELQSNVIGYPEVGDIVIGEVDEVADFGVLVGLDEYEHMRGHAHISEVASGWVKDVRDHVQAGQTVVAKVLDVDESSQQIDLSIKDLNEHQRKIIDDENAGKEGQKEQKEEDSEQDSEDESCSTSGNNPVDKNSINVQDEDGYNSLIDIIGKAPSRGWIEIYLDWMKKALEANSIRSTDECFATTFSTGSYKGITLGGNARCIKIMPSDESIDVLMPRKINEFEDITLNRPGNDRSYGVNTTELPNGKYYWLPTPEADSVLTEYEDDWIEATKVELSGPSSNRNTHENVIYRAIVEESSRKAVLNDAF